MHGTWPVPLVIGGANRGKGSLHVSLATVSTCPKVTFHLATLMPVGRINILPLKCVKWSFIKNTLAESLLLLLPHVTCLAELKKA